MSRFSGPQHPGAMRGLRERKRAEAEGRNEAYRAEHIIHAVIEESTTIHQAVEETTSIPTRRRRRRPRKDTA